MTFDLLEIWHAMGLFARGIVATLTLMAIASMAVFVERLWTFRRARVSSGYFGGTARGLLDRHEYDSLLREAEQTKGSPLATLVAAGLKTYLVAVRRKHNNLPPIELTKRELARAADAVAGDVRRGFGLLASVGSVAPFVGLLGTVVGIIAAFEGIAREGSGGIGAVSSGIAEALVVTALGLLVAIPAVLAFNYLSGKADQLILALDRSKGELVDHLENNSDEHTRGAELSAA